MATKVLVVDDEANLVNLVKGYLEREGFAVSTAADGATALRLAREQCPDLVVLDLMLPEVDGLEVCRQLRQWSDAYVIMLTARAEEVDKVVGLSVGADDYITKPFDADEMLVRVQRVLSRVGGAAHPPQPLIVVDDHLAIDFAGNRVVLDGESNPLTPTESAILSVLYRQRGKVVANETLMARVWPGEEVFEDRLRVHVFRLRTKLRSPVSGETYVVTERGVGYSFTVPNDHVPNKPR